VNINVISIALDIRDNRTGKLFALYQSVRDDMELISRILSIQSRPIADVDQN
jgi:hypothetical protein